MAPQVIPEESRASHPNDIIHIYMLLSKEGVEELETSMLKALSHSTKSRTNTTILGVLDAAFQISSILTP
jgi:hypothetical protein